MKLSAAGIIIIVIALIVWGALLITAAAFIFQLLLGATPKVDPAANSHQNMLKGWAGFGAVVLGIVGVLAIIQGIAWAVIGSKNRWQIDTDKRLIL